MNRLLSTEPEDALDKAKAFSDRIWEWFSDADMWANVLFTSIRIIVIFILTRIIIKVANSAIQRSLERKEGGRISSSRRFTTVGELLKNTVTVALNFAMVIMILNELNFKLGPLLAGAGVLGLAVGFGAQGLVKDIITGFFIILEDQFAVGDIIQTGSYKGTVQMIGLRTTRLLSFTGEVHILPNGSISNVTNYSLSNALAVVDIPVKLDQDLDTTIRLIGGAMRGIEERHPQVTGYPDILGIQSMSTSEYVVRVAANCLPGTKEEAERQILIDIKLALERQARLTESTESG